MYILNASNLPDPQGFKREPIFIGSAVTMLDGSTKRDVVRRKWKYTLIFEKLTQAEVTDIINLYNLNSQLTFQCTDANNSITAVPVLMDIGTREYNTAGGDYREDIQVILTEV